MNYIFTTLNSTIDKYLLFHCCTDFVMFNVLFCVPSTLL